ERKRGAASKEERSNGIEAELRRRCREIFFLKQKTAYEMVSDWSSDVCSSDLFNQAVRRIRRASTQEELLATLLDAASGFANGVAIFRIHGEVARGERIRGVPEDIAEVFGDFEIPLASAAALAGAAESRDPVIAATTGAEVSGEMAGLASHGQEDRASIFPLVVENRVPALLYAWGDVQGAALELFAQVAAR